MSLFVDTSFLCSLYGHDLHTESVMRLLKKTAEPISITALNEYEWVNSVHLSVYRKIRHRHEASQMIAAYEFDKESGSLILIQGDLVQVINEAKGLSTTYGSNGGYRSFDVLHVAAAKCFGAKRFLTFDSKQKKLAWEVGLEVSF